MSAAIKKWEDRISAEWRAQWVKQGYNPTEAAMMGEIGELRAAVASHQGVAVPDRWISEVCGPSVDDLSYGQGFRDGFNQCRDVVLELNAAPQPPAVKEAEPVGAPTTLAVLQDAETALEAMLEQFTRTPSTLADTTARGKAHAALKAIKAAVAAPVSTAESQ